MNDLCGIIDVSLQKFGCCGMRIVLGAILWGFGGIIFGAINGAAIGWATHQPIPQTTLMAAAAAGVFGAIYGLLSPPPKRSAKKKRSSIPDDLTRFNLKPCAWCRGTGVEGKKQQECSVCGGYKNVVVKRPHMVCPKCKGKGRVFMGRKCNTCRGAGWETYGFLE